MLLSTDAPSSSVKYKNVFFSIKIFAPKMHSLLSPSHNSPRTSSSSPIFLNHPFYQLSLSSPCLSSPPLDLSLKSSPVFQNTALPQHQSTPDVSAYSSSTIQPSTTSSSSSSSGKSLTDASSNKNNRDRDRDDKDKPTKVRQRTAMACSYCRRRKIRCSGLVPSDTSRKCTNCSRLNQECIFAPVMGVSASLTTIPITNPQLHLQPQQSQLGYPIYNHPQPYQYQVPSNQPQYYLPPQPSSLPPPPPPPSNHPYYQSIPTPYGTTPIQRAGSQYYSPNSALLQNPQSQHQKTPWQYGTSQQQLPPIQPQYQFSSLPYGSKPSNIINPSSDSSSPHPESSKPNQSSLSLNQDSQSSLHSPPVSSITHVATSPNTATATQTGPLGSISRSSSSSSSSFAVGSQPSSTSDTFFIAPKSPRVRSKRGSTLLAPTSSLHKGKKRSVSISSSFPHRPLPAQFPLSLPQPPPSPAVASTLPAPQQPLASSLAAPFHQPHQQQFQQRQVTMSSSSANTQSSHQYSNRAKQHGSPRTVYQSPLASHQTHHSPVAVQRSPVTMPAATLHHDQQQSRPYNKQQSYSPIVLPKPGIVSDRMVGHEGIVGIGTSVSSNFSPSGDLKISGTIQHDPRRHDQTHEHGSYNFTQGYNFDSWRLKNVDLGANNPGSSSSGSTPATSGNVTRESEPQQRQEGDHLGYQQRRHSKQRLIQRSQSLDPGTGGRQQTSFRSSFPTSLPTSLSPYSSNHPTQSTLARQGIEGLYGTQPASGTNRTQGFSTFHPHSPLASTISEPKTGYSGDVSSSTRRRSVSGSKTKVRRKEGESSNAGIGSSDVTTGSGLGGSSQSLEGSRANQPIPSHDTHKSEQDKKKKRKSGKVSISDLLD